MNKKIIGILGGMGPGASAALYQKMIADAQNRYNAVQDADYPPLILYSLPLDGFTEHGIEDPQMVEEELVEAVQKLSSAGCSLIVIACNTVHHFFSSMQKAIDVPILNIVEETFQKVFSDGHKKIGLLASESTIKMRLYTTFFEKHGIEVLIPTESQLMTITRVIKHVMGGHQNSLDVLALKEIISDFFSRGASAVVLGCTELPLAINQTHTDIKLYDSMDMITQKAVDFSLNS